MMQIPRPKYLGGHGKLVLFVFDVLKRFVLLVLLDKDRLLIDGDHLIVP